MMSPWTFPHPPRGTCISGCPAYASCHCGCGEAPKRAGVNHREGLRVAGQPNVFRAGHHARVFSRQGGIWSRRGIEVERVRPLLAWLHERYGDWRTVAHLLDIPVPTLKGYANNRKRKRVPPDAAWKIQQLVLAHRRPRTWVDDWELDEPVLGTHAHQRTPSHRRVAS